MFAQSFAATSLWRPCMTALGYVWQPEATTMDGPFTYLVSVDLGFPSKPGDQLSQVLRTQVQTPISRLGETWNLHRLVIYSCTISQSSLQDQNFGGVLEVIFLTFKVIPPATECDLPRGVGRLATTRPGKAYPSKSQAVQFLYLLYDCVAFFLRT